MAHLPERMGPQPGRRPLQTTHCGRISLLPAPAALERGAVRVFSSRALLPLVLLEPLMLMMVVVLGGPPTARLPQFRIANLSLPSQESGSQSAGRGVEVADTPN